MVVAKQVQPCPAYTNKDWHRVFPVRMRSTLIHKCIRLLVPTFDPAAQVVSSHTQEIITFVKHLEVHLYENGSTPVYYLRKLMDRVTAIRERIKDKAQQMMGKAPAPAAARTRTQ